MIPLRLELQGLHSYRDPVTVGFADLVEDGFFGIFGPTGSGKSSLLDAITLALYGSIDRLGGRDISPMIHVDADELTVRYRFQLGEATYEAYRRFVTRDGGASTRDAHLRHLGKDAVLASSAREVNAEVQDLLGMDFDQFTRAVFLPQGKFAEFLEDTPTQRIELLGEIFGLDRYGETLRKRARDRRDALKNELSGIQGELKALEDATGERVDAVRAEASSVADCIHLLRERKQAIAGRVSDARQLRGELQRLARAREALEELEESADEVEAMRDRVDEAEAAAELFPTLADLRDHRASLAEVEERIEELEDAVASRAEALEAAEQAREDRADDLEDREAALREARVHLGNVEDRADRWDELADEREELQGKLEELDAPEDASLEGVPLLDPDSVLGTVRDGVQAAGEVTRIAGRLQEVQDERDAKQGQLERTEARLDELRAEVQELEDAHEAKRAEVEDAKVRDRAAVLVTELEEGDRCPVCGSTEHPEPASPPDAALEGLEDEAEEAHEAWVDAQKRVKEAETTVSNLQDRVGELDADAGELADDLEAARSEEAAHREALPPQLQDEDWADAEAKVSAWKRAQEARQLQDRLREVQGQLADLRTEWTQVTDALALDADEPTPAARAEAAEALEQELADVEAAQDALEDAVDAARDELEEVRGDLTKAEGRRDTLADGLTKLQARLTEGLEASPFDTADALEAAHFPADELQALQDEVEEHDEALRSTRQTVDELEARVEATGLDRAEADAVLHEHAQIEDVLETAHALHGKLEDRARDLAADLERKRQLEATRDDLDQQAGYAERLTNLLGGRRFVEFLARDRFRVVLDQASRRLAQVSGGRYHLQGDPREIRIVDHLEGGEVRDHRTLSGGETFMVSLSLALALSDAIQHERGGGYPPVEFFFLDEGFGSLDQDTLDTVMRMLRELVDQDVHVGLITHVTDVQKYVPRKLLVEGADEDGGSRVTVER